MVDFKKPTRAQGPTEGASFLGYHRLIVADWEAYEGKYVAISPLKKTGKTIFGEI